MTGPDSNDSQPDSRDASPAGEGKRLDEASSRSNGSSSALHGVGAAHQTGGGGAAGRAAVGKMQTGADEHLPAYSENDPQHTLAETEGMDMDPDEGIADMDQGPYDYNYNYKYNTNMTSQPAATWSFTHNRNSPEAQPLGIEGDENLFDDDNRSLQAGVSELSDAERDRMADFDDDPGTTRGGFGTPLMEPQRAPPPITAEDYEEPAVEIRLEDEHADELA